MMKKILLLVPLLVVACGVTSLGEGPSPSPTARTEVVPIPTPSGPDATGAAPGEPASSALPADVEAYYQAMVVIEGTAQLMQKIDLEQLSDNEAGFAPPFMMPGVMDDRVSTAQQAPVPAALAPAWEKALEAHDEITAAFESFMMTMAQDAFVDQVSSSTRMVSQAVAEAEDALSAEYGPQNVALGTARQEALNELGSVLAMTAGFIDSAEQARSDHSLTLREHYYEETYAPAWPETTPFGLTGEVSNGSSTWYGEVLIYVDFLDSKGDVVDTQWIAPETSWIAPGDDGVFSAWGAVGAAWGTVASHQYRIEVGEMSPDGPPGAAACEAMVEEMKVFQDGVWYGTVLQGKFLNNSHRPVEFNVVSYGLYDGEGHVLETGTTLPEADLISPNETTSFETSVSWTLAEPQTYRVWSECFADEGQ